MPNIVSLVLLGILPLFSVFVSVPRLTDPTAARDHGGDADDGASAAWGWTRSAGGSGGVSDGINPSSLGLRATVVYELLIIAVLASVVDSGTASCTLHSDLQGPPSARSGKRFGSCCNQASSRQLSQWGASALAGDAAMATATTTTTTTTSTTAVFVRVRPLTSTEREQGTVELEDIRKLSTHEDGRESSVLPGLGGFSGIIGQEASNADVCERCFGERLGTVLGGGAVSLFCYGYTGGGKTHTVLGYGEERGLYFLAAERLLGELRALQPEGGQDQRLFLEATACEIYNDKVYDLLGETKVQCTLRTDETGALRVMGPAVSEEDSAQDPSQVDGLLAQMTPQQRAELQQARDRMDIGEQYRLSAQRGRELQEVTGADAMGIPSVGDGSLHSTAVTRSEGLRSISVHQAEDLEDIGRSSVASRTVGSSTEHAQSSRSHAILRLEVVTETVLTRRAALDAARSLLPARKNALDNLTNVVCKLLFDPGDPAAGGNPMLRVSETDVREEAYQDAIARNSEDMIWSPKLGFEGWRVEGWAVRMSSCWH